MKVSLLKLNDAGRVLQALGGEKMPPLLAYKIARIIREVNPHLTDLAAGHRALLRDAENASPSDEPHFQRQLEVLMGQEVELPDSLKLNYGDIEKMPELPPMAFVALDWLLDDECNDTSQLSESMAPLLSA